MYLMGIIMIIVVILLTAVFSGGISGVDVACFIDMPSLLSILLIVVPVLVAADAWKDVNQAFRMIITRKWDATLNELKRAEHGLQILINAFTTSGIFVSVCSVFSVLFVVRREDGMEMGKLCANLAVALIPVIYALIFRLLIVPLKATVQKHIIDFMESEV